MEIERDRSVEENLPEIEENVARGEIAALYQDIRSTLSVPKVNLIYRYFATIDGGLASIWSILRPHFQNGQFPALAQQISALFAVDDEHYQLLSSVRPDIGQREKISSTLDFYLTANPMNLFALEFLAEALDRPADKSSPNSPLVSPAELRTRIDIENFSNRIDELMSLVSQGATSIRPTLLRELQQWPAFVEAVFPYIKTCCVDAGFDQRVARIRSQVKTQTAALGKPRRLDLGPLASQEVAEFCGYFPTILIRMTLIAAGLRRALQELKP